MDKTPFYHLLIDNVDSRQALDFCRSCFQSDKTHSIYFVNAHCFNVSKTDSEYLHTLNQCDLLLNDGIGIKIASKLTNVVIKENMNGTDFIPKILSLSATQNKGVYLLGAKPEVVDTARVKLQQRHKGLDIRGVSSGYFTVDEEDDIVARINASGAEVLVVGMGVPLQEKWIAKHKHKLTHVKIVVAGGAIIDFSAAAVKRAPELIQAVGMEWLFRFVQEPRRLFKRYFVGNLVFFMHIIAHQARLPGVYPGGNDQESRRSSTPTADGFDDLLTLTGKSSAAVADEVGATAMLDGTDADTVSATKVG